MEAVATKNEIYVARQMMPHGILPFVESCFHEIAEHGTPIAGLEHYINTERDCWLCVYHRDYIIGYVKLTPRNMSMLEIHPFIGKKYRRYSKAAMEAVLEYFDRLGGTYRSIVTNIPACKRHAILLAKRIGFKEVGRFAEGFNQKHDMIMFQRMRFKHG